MNKTEIKRLLTEHGLAGVATTRRVADVLGITVQTINAAKNAGKIRQLDRNCYDVDSIVNWLYGNPRYLVKICERPLPPKE